MADAFMDLLSSVVLLWATRQAARPNLMKYPAVNHFAIIIQRLQAWPNMSFALNRERHVWKLQELLYLLA